MEVRRTMRGLLIIEDARSQNEFLFLRMISRDLILSIFGLRLLRKRITRPQF